MKLAKVNCATVGVFAWAALEPEEGRFEFAWLDQVLDDLHREGIQAILATPTGSKPAWMSRKYPEIRRVGRDGKRQPHQGRHNHCYSSPLYREKSVLINTKLAERYGNHPAVILWHVNNEYNHGECHCGFCYANFRAWLKDRFKTLEALNKVCWNAFWSHTYSDWDQVEPVDAENLGLELLWRKFTTHLCVDYFRAESAPLRALTPHLPLTTNFMGAWFPGLDYDRLADAEDIVSWDSYPAWHQGDDIREASATAFSHDAMRAMKGGKPFLLMESTPEGTNWMEVGKAKRPGLLAASALQAIAHGSDSNLYFQWRKGQGGFEQFHGAVVDHAGHEDTRVFREVSGLGKVLERLTPVLGTGVRAEVGILYDWENRWAIEFAKGPRNSHKDYERDVQDHYHEFWRRGIVVDPIGTGRDFSRYKLLVAPYLYGADQQLAVRIKDFVAGGGTFVTTYLAGTVDGNGLCHLGGRPGPLRELLGIWAEETDVLLDHEDQAIQGIQGNPLRLKGPYAVRHYADIVHLEGARSLASYKKGWYAKTPAVTVNRFGQGEAYYLASRNDREFLSGFYGNLLKRTGIRPLLAKVPRGVEVSERTDGKDRYLFLVNFLDASRTVPLGVLRGQDLVSGKKVGRSLRLPPYGSAVIHRA